MENDKPTYEAIEQELNEYKELLWQLSDEYRTNMSNVEKKLEEETKKIAEFQKTSNISSPLPRFSFISDLGMPACVTNSQGEIIKYNNKFKFLVELLSYEIEEISNITTLLNKDKVERLDVKLLDHFSSENGIFQSLFRVENSFQNLVNLIFRVYKLEPGQEHLALFIELHKLEISGLVTNEVKTDKKEEKSALSIATSDSEIEMLRNEIAIFSEKYDVYSEIARLFENSEAKTVDSLQDSVKQSFNLENSRNKILEKLNIHYKDFVTLIIKKYPDLTSNEEKHCMLIRAGLTYKEISSIMDISINGVKIARNRLRKKLDLENDTKTSEFIEKV